MSAAIPLRQRPSSVGPGQGRLVIQELRHRWLRSSYPRLVDHARGVQICPAPTLYVGARAWALKYQELGRRAGHGIALSAHPSPEVVMQVFAAIRLGATALVGGVELGYPGHDGLRGLRFPGGGRISEEQVLEFFAGHQGISQRMVICERNWALRATWVDVLLPALASGAEIHVNVDPEAV